MDKRKYNKKRSESYSHPRRGSHPSKPELEEFFESVHERMKDLAIAQKTYKSRNDKELSVKPGEFFEVLDDAGLWWCLRAPSGRTGHVPKTYLEIIPNPAKETERFNNQPMDPIVVKVPVIVKASVQHHEMEEKGKSSSAKQGQVTSSPTVQSSLPAQPQTEGKPEIPAPASAPNEQKVGTAANYPPLPPQSIFPPINYTDRQPYHTVVKEVIREVPPYRQYRRTKSRQKIKRDASPQYSEDSRSSCSSKTSSSSSVASWISDGAHDRMVSRRRGSSRSRRPKSQQQAHRSLSRQRKQEPLPPPLSPHQLGHCCHGARDSTCRYRSVCCYSSKGSRARSTITDMSHRGSGRKDSQHQKPSQQSQQQPQQPMIILLEAPKQENISQPQVQEEQVVDDYYDPNNQPQISIVLPPNAQLGSAMTAYTPLQPVIQQPQYVQAPTYYNWTPQYYQGYA